MPVDPSSNAHSTRSPDPTNVGATSTIATPGSWFKRWWRLRPLISSDTLIFGTALYVALVGNLGFLEALLQGRSWASPSTWIFLVAMLVMLTALHTFLFGLVAHRRWARPLMSVMLVVTALGSFYVQRYAVYLDPTMIRNTLHTDPAEASELIGWDLIWHLLITAAIPIALVWWARLEARRWLRAIATRLGLLLLAAVAAVGAVLLVFQDFASLMRNQKETRYLITPANIIYSSARVLAGNAREVRTQRVVVGADARPDASWATRKKPLLMVLVVGETARAANWGLSGYARQTTPMLAALMASNAGGSTQGSSDLLLNFNDVTACGTNTETSLPCMFSAIGRRDYDEHRIRTSESLLHVIHRAGVPVRWRDNQSGCKGVCDGLPVDALDKMTTPGLCADGRCFDEILLRDFDAVVAQPRATQVTTPVGASSSTTPAAISADASAVGAANSTAAVPASVGASRLIVLHMLGNHGPTYHKRYPASFGRFTPTCDTGELRQCSPASIVNAYDNALLYTDHVLAQLIQKLKSLQDRYDTAMVYVSDHGESLGERGLYLHGVPYAIAPKEQLKVPMVWWLSAGYLASAAIDGTCLTDQTSASWAHDNLFHTLLGLWRIRASEYDAKLDVQARCASPAMR